MNALLPYLALCRTGISLFAAFSAVTGYLLIAPDPSGAAPLAAGVLLLSCGASGMNQYQERDIDKRMERTRRRPLPAGVLSPLRALAFSLLLILAGLAVLARSGPLAPGLSLLALVWYNGLYTALKRRTAFAALYGAVVGAIPPVIGWTAGGGALLDQRLFAVALFFLFWQVPHFWMLLLQRDADYRAAGLPVLTDLFGTARLARLTALWSLAAAVMPLLLPLFGVVRSPLVMWSLLPAAVVPVIAALRSLGLPPSPAAFRWINAFLAVVMLLLSLDPFLYRRG